jgi:hypothetical protein
VPSINKKRHELETQKKNKSKFFEVEERNEGKKERKKGSLITN